MAVFERLLEDHLHGGSRCCRTGPPINPLSEGVCVMKKFALITTALVLSGSIFSIAQAAPPSDVPTAVVKFGDLDTTGSAGK